MEGRLVWLGKQCRHRDVFSRQMDLHVTPFNCQQRNKTIQLHSDFPMQVIMRLQHERNWQIMSQASDLRKTIFLKYLMMNIFLSSSLVQKIVFGSNYLVIQTLCM